MILAYRPYDVDDRVKVAGAEGMVKCMNLLATTVATIDNQMLVVPDGRIWGDTIVNFTANRVRRADAKVNVSQAEDPDRVHAVLMDVLEQHEHVLAKPEPEVHMVGMEDSAVAEIAGRLVRAGPQDVEVIGRVRGQQIDTQDLRVLAGDLVIHDLSARNRPLDDAQLIDLIKV